MIVLVNVHGKILVDCDVDELAGPVHGPQDGLLEAIMSLLRLNLYPKIELIETLSTKLIHESWLIDWLQEVS